MCTMMGRSGLNRCSALPGCAISALMAVRAWPSGPSLRHCHFTSLPSRSSMGRAIALKLGQKHP